MKSTVQHWGNSLALRIPKGRAEEVGIGQGSEVTITVVDGSLVLTPVRARRLALTDLLQGIKPSNLHREVATGARVGREAW